MSTTRKKRTEWTPEVQDRFLAALSACGLIGRSAEIADISWSAVKKHVASDEEFAALVEEAQQRYNESLEMEVHRRGFKGYDEPVFGKEGQIGTRRKYSDALALAHVKRRIPAYREKPIDLNVAKGGVLVVGQALTSVDEWQKDHEEGEPDEGSSA